MESLEVRRICLLLAGALVGPPAVLSLYFGLAWLLIRDGDCGFWCLLAPAFGIGSGVACICWLPLRDILRGLVALIYVPVASFGLLLYWVIVAAMFHQCL
jgi:hypothetical protein